MKFSVYDLHIEEERAGNKLLSAIQRILWWPERLGARKDSDGPWVIKLVLQASGGHRITRCNAKNNQDVYMTMQLKICIAARCVCSWYFRTRNRIIDWRIPSNGMWHRVIWWVGTPTIISVEPPAFSFMFCFVLKMVAAGPPETFVIYLPNCMVSHSIRQ